MQPLFRALIAIITVALITPLNGILRASDGCFTIVVGKDASVDGSVIMAHNEDDAPPQLVNHYKVVRQHRDEGEVIQLLKGGTQERYAPFDFGYIQSEIPGLKFSDSFINEKGVCITSDACRSREGNPELTDGGITKTLRLSLLPLK